MAPVRDGRRAADESPTAFPAPIDPDLWSAVQERRSHRRTRAPGSPRRGFYALKIRCQGCGLHLRGDTRRYRHPQPICDAWLAAQPRATGPRRGRHTTSLGHGYAAEMYEGLVEVILRRIGEPDAGLITQVVAEYNKGAGTKDEVALARIGRERDAAMGRYLKTRDSAELDATMRRLDAEQDAAAASSEAEPLSPEEVVAYLRDLPRLWREASPEARQLIAASLFEETSALGWRVFSYRWTAHAIRRGLGDVIPGELHLTDDEMVLVGARGIAPPPTTFRSPCGSPRLQSPPTGSRAHDAASVPTRQARDRP